MKDIERLKDRRMNKGMERQPGSERQKEVHWYNGKREALRMYAFVHVLVWVCVLARACVGRYWCAIAEHRAAVACRDPPRTGHGVVCGVVPVEGLGREVPDRECRRLLATLLYVLCHRSEHHIIWPVTPRARNQRCRCMELSGAA
jgi:hypothetical protein